MKRISWVPDLASSGVTSIPSELLDPIFEFAVAESYIKTHPSKNEMPIVLMHVCTQWRKIAIRNRRLWVRFCVDLDGTSISSRILKLLRRTDVTRSISCAMVNRAGGLPLQLDGNWDHFFLATDEQVEELIMRLSDSSIIPFLFHGPEMLGPKKLLLSFHPLQLHDLNWTNIYHTIATATNPTVFHSMRNLQTLEITSNISFIGHALLQCQDIPWHQLITLCMGFPSVNIEMLRGCLSRCDSLENLNLCFTEDDDAASDLPEPEIKILPKLKFVKYATASTRSLHVLGIQWTMLKHVQLNIVDSSPAAIAFIHLSRVLQDLKNVETLDFKFIHPIGEVGELEYQDQYHLPRLKTLSMKTLYPRIISLFKVHLLRELTLAVPGGHISLIAPLLQMIKASLCTITVFHCYDFKVDSLIPFNQPTHWPDYLTYRQESLMRIANFLATYMPRVERVQGFTMMFDVKLMLRIAAGLAFPRIQEIRCFLPSSYVDLLLDVIEARAEGRGHGGRVWKVLVAIHGTISERTRARLVTVVNDSGIVFGKKELYIPTLEVVFTDKVNPTPFDLDM